MEEFTSVAFWFIIALMSTNVVFAWLTVNGGIMALTTTPDSIMASNDCYAYTATSSVNIVTESVPNNPVQTAIDFGGSQVCTVNSVWVLAGGWQIALGQVFTGGIFGDPTDSASLGWLYLGVIMPVLILAQIIAMFLVLYRVAIAAKGLLGAAVGL